MIPIYNMYNKHIAQYCLISSFLFILVVLYSSIVHRKSPVWIDYSIVSYFCKTCFRDSSFPVTRTRYQTCEGVVDPNRPPVPVVQPVVPKRGLGFLYPPNNWTPSPNNYKIHTLNIFTLPNPLNGDRLLLRTWPTRPKLWNCQLVLRKWPSCPKKYHIRFLWIKMKISFFQNFWGTTLYL